MSGKARNDGEGAAGGDRRPVWGASQSGAYQSGASGTWGQSSKKKASLSESQWTESAGSLVLLAAAQATGLVQELAKVGEATLAAATTPRLGHSRHTTREQLLLTLLFMPMVGVQRTWNLRSYTGDGLALLSGRRQAYGYKHTERFLSQLAKSGGDEIVTDSLARWTTQLWPLPSPSAAYYIDGHKKAVYSDKILPRSLIGRVGKILGCRALTLLMDEVGHPLFVLTARGDDHLTVGLPTLVNRYERAIGHKQVSLLVVDREAMSAPLLKDLSPERTVIPLLRSDPYKDLESFGNVGAFVPLASDDGNLVREVASATFAVSVPEQKGEMLSLAVALIRDWRKQVPLPTTDEQPPRWNADLDSETRWQWWFGHFVATPAPPLPPQPKLIPMVSTATTLPPLDMAQTYTQRWVAQENIIRDFLLPLGLDTNHGYAKTPIVNSEVLKRRAVLQKRLE